MRKFLVFIAATSLMLVGAGCGSQTHQSFTPATTTDAAAVSWAGPVNAPSARSIVGTWRGDITPSPATGASPQRFTIVVARGERSGWWRIGLRCTGTLRLKDISAGYHHYYRVAGTNPKCATLGVDCLKRDGAQMFDWFVPEAGWSQKVYLRAVRLPRPDTA